MKINGSVDFSSVQEFMEGCVNLLKTFGVGNQFHGYVSLEDFVLRHGKPWPIRPRPKDVKCGPMRECYRNAALLAMEQPSRFTYCEGFARGLLPVMHAWVVDNKGRVIETTWRGRHWGVDYFGVAIKVDYLTERLHEQSHFGLIDQPKNKWQMLRDDPKQWRHPINDL